MPIDTNHPIVASMAPRWRRCRDAVAGQWAIHEAGELYLPKLTEQTSAEYAAYKGRAGWYGATGRTLQGLVGMVFRRSPVLTAPAALDAIAADVTLKGESAESLARQVLSDMIQAGRVGLLVEYPQGPQNGGPVTLADAVALNRRPYVTGYATETIVNWREQRVNNVMQPVLVVLAETAPKTEDRYSHETVPQRRELALESGKYVQRVYRTNDKGEWVQFGGDIVPLRNGAALGSIPFVCVSPEGFGLDPQKPPIEDLADVNVGHYRNTADLEHGAHFTGLPTPIITGYQATENERVPLGSTQALCFPNPDTRATFLEFTGTGLAALEERCKAKEAQMAALGARMLAPEKAGVESSDALSSRQNGEQSVLANYATLAGEAVQKVLRLAAEWEGISGEITYELSKDYTPAGLTAQDLTALVAAWQSGAISWETLFFNLKEGEIVATDVDEDDERGRLETAAPTGAANPALAA